MNEENFINIRKLPPLTRLIYTIGELPTSYLMSMTYEEQLIWLCNYLAKTVIPTINNNADLVVELEDYIKNLDLDSEVRTVLNEMIEDGTLEEIINQEIFGELNSKVTTLENKTANLTTDENNIQKLLKFNEYTNKPLKYGKLNYPTEFSDIPFNLYRDNDNKIYDDLDLTSYDTTSNIVYVDYDNGNDTTHENATFKTIKGALTYINARTGNNFKILCKTYRFCRGEVWNESGDNTTFVTNKNIVIAPYDETKRIMIAPEQRGLSWNNEGGGVWSTTRAGVTGMYNLQVTDGFGMHPALTKVDSLEDCQSTVESWYLSGSTLYVHTRGNLQPTFERYMVRLGLHTFDVDLNGNHFLRLRNIDFYPSAHIGFRNSSSSSYESTAIMENVRIYGTNDNNGFSFVNVKYVYVLNCVTGENLRDGFNYHYDDLPSAQITASYVYEKNTTSFRNGLNDTNHNNNCSTIHEGGRIIRVNNVYQNSKGPIVADIGSPRVLMINCNVTQEISGSSFNLAYDFLDATGSNSGIAYLIDCTSNQYQTLSLNGSENFKIRLKNFKGNYENSDLDIQLYNE